MTTATPGMTDELLDQLHPLAVRLAGIYDDPIPADADDYHAQHNARRLAALQIAEEAARLYVEATGRCATYIEGTLDTVAQGDTPTPGCRNRAKAPGVCCGTHQPGWDHTLLFARARVESDAKLHEAQAVADQLHAHGLDTTGIGAGHVALSLDAARALADHLAQAGGLHQ